MTVLRAGLQLAQTTCITFARKGRIMLTTIAIILLVLWLLGLVSSATLGGFIHILLVVALVLLVVRLVQRVA